VFLFDEVEYGAMATIGRVGTSRTLCISHATDNLTKRVTGIKQDESKHSASTRKSTDVSTCVVSNSGL